jgi:hypothetical protein
MGTNEEQAGKLVFIRGPDWLAQATEHDPIGCKQTKSRANVRLVTGYMQHIQHWVPGAAQSEATISIKIPGMKPDLDGFFYDPVHESSHLTLPACT